MLKNAMVWPYKVDPKCAPGAYYNEMVQANNELWKETAIFITQCAPIRRSLLHPPGADAVFEILIARVI